MHTIKIAISTCTHFEDKTLPILIPSLISAGIDPNDIHVFCAGHDKFTSEKTQLYHYHTVDNNSYEYTPLIAIVEYNLETEYWFLIHDTCKVGSKFKELLYSIPQSKPEKIALTYKPSMSIGSYRYDYLLTMKDKLMSIKNQDYSKEALQEWKNWGVDAEDYILWQSDPKPALYSPNVGNTYWSRMQRINKENWYGTSTNRLVEYFPPLDLFKNKSNWERKRKEEYITVV